MLNQIQKNRPSQSKRSNMLVSNSRTDFNNSNDQSDYEIVIEFELRREREKTRILEERLHNKQVFIQQMKQYQDQLTLAYEKCQEELIVAKKALQKFYLTEKNYIQQIQDLKHLVIRLQDQINLRDKDMNRRHYSSVKQDQGSPFKKRQARSKTLMNQQEDSPKGLRDPLEQEIIKDSKRIAKFVKQFLMMVGCFYSQGKNDVLKNRLKLAWKWIKQVVKEWNDLANQKLTWENFVDKANEGGRFSKLGNSEEVYNKILTLIKSK